MLNFQYRHSRLFLLEHFGLPQKLHFCGELNIYMTPVGDDPPIASGNRDITKLRDIKN